MSMSLPHLVVLPIVLPLLTAAFMLLLRDARRRLASIVNIAATAAGLLVALAILVRVDDGGGAGTIGVYLASNWEAPFGIVLVADRLSALMLVLTAVVSLGAAVYASAVWDRTGVYFHPLFQIQLMGLNGAFLTGDLFNLFVFFEVMLAASYGLQLHGSGWARIRTGLHYIAVNLLASSLFLVGLAMIYGVMGTLCMADVAAKLADVPPGDRGLLLAGISILAVTFLTKAAIWPLNSWLVPTYMAASAPVAALFAVMTKVGIYTLLRLWTLIFSADAGPSAYFGSTVFLVGGLLTLGFGTLGSLASFRVGRIASFSILVSSGTLLSAVGFGAVSLTAAALFYMLSATLAASAMFLLVELLERPGTGVAVTPPPVVDAETQEDTNLDDDEVALVGRAIPVSMALLGLAFIACTLLIAGLPPLSGFVAKLVLLRELLQLGDLPSSPAAGAASWWLFGLLLVSGLLSTVSLARAGIRHFWSEADRPPPRVSASEAVPLLLLLLACVGLTVCAEPVLRYTHAIAEALHAPAGYIDAVLSATPVPGPTRPRLDEVGGP
jgi:multicomponent K+:H+ antiporter subunit D